MEPANPKRPRRALALSEAHSPQLEKYAGQEWSCRTLAFLFSELEREGLSPELLAQGVDHPLSTLRDSNARIDWPSACRLFENLARHRSQQEIVDLGGRAAHSPALRWLGLTARMLYSMTELYEFASAHIRDHCACAETSSGPVGPGHLRMHVSFAPGYEPSRPVFWGIQGAWITLPVLIGLPPATVHVEEFGRSAIYEVYYTERMGPLTWLRHALTWPFTARGLARELRDAHRLMNRRMLDAARSERNYRSLMEQAGDAILIFDGSRILDVNQQACAQLGYAREQLVRLDIGRVGGHEADSHEVLPELRKGQRVIREGELVRSDGSRFPVEMSLKMLDDGRIQMISRDITERKQLDLERALQKQRLEDAVQERTAQLERLNQELRNLQSSLIQAERLDAAEDLAASVAHAINNPLAALMGNLQMLKQDPSLIEPVLDRTFRLAERIRAVVLKTLQLFRNGSMDIRIELVQDILGDLAEELAVAAEAQGVQLEFITEPDLPKIPVDRALVTAALVSIGENGIEAMPNGGVLRIETAHMREVGIVEIRVIDEGPGIPAALGTKVLEPFFTTKGGGTGLGLAIASGVIQGHSGRLRLENAPEGGASVTVELPASTTVGARPREAR